MSSSVALVLEGGGYRGLFSAGVLDVFQENKLYGFESIWGVSAGAIGAVSFKSRQIGRTMRDILAFRDDRRFMSLYSLATTGNLAGAEFMYEEIQNVLDPCDNKTFNNNPLKMYAVASDVIYGTPVYQEVKEFPRDVPMVQASASMPLVSRIVELNGRLLLDGGTTDSIPVAAALGLSDAVMPEGFTPAQKAVVILTQDPTYVKSGANERVAVRSHRYDNYPYYAQALATRAEKYNACREMVHQMAREGRIYVIEPQRPVEVSTSGASGQKCLELYLWGREEATRHLDEIRAYMEG